MAEVETARIMAKYKIKLMFLFVVFVGVCGVFMEYQRSKQPLDEATVIFVSGSNTADVTVTPQANTQVKMPKDEVKNDKVNPSVVINAENVKLQENESQKEPEQVDNPQALADFLAELQRVQGLVAAAQYSEPVLNKVIQAEPQATPKEAEPKIFQDGAIEIYDSNKGVVDVVTEDKSDTTSKAAIKNDTANEKETENNKEKSLEKEAPQTEGDTTVNSTAEAMTQIQTLEEKDIEAVAEKEKNIAQQAEESVRERVNKDLGMVENAGEEAPIVLIPGLAGNTPPENVSADE